MQSVQKKEEEGNYQKENHPQEKDQLNYQEKDNCQKDNFVIKEKIYYQEEDTLYKEKVYERKDCERKKEGPPKETKTLGERRR